MVTGRNYKFWFCTGSQDLYGDECLRKVAEHSRIIVEELNKSGVLPFELVWKPTLITNELIRKTFNEANADDECAGVITWMHTFSPAKSWILGLKEYRKPLCHLHTQFNQEIPYDTIDMDFMNENQSAHGGREYGHIVTRMGIERKVIVGHWADKKVQERLASWMRTAVGIMESSHIRVCRVADNMRNVAVMRLGSLAMCKVLKDAGMDPIFQLACRDRNRIALESDLLSAAMFGIENILCLTGDHTKMGDHPQAKPVFDLDSVSLLHTVKLLESGVLLGGNELVGEPPKFSKGAVVSPCSDSVDAQLAKMERKVAAGADYFQTQAVFEPEKFIKFMEKAKQFGKPVQVGIIIPKSVGMVRFMNNNVAGIHVPDEMIEELKADKEKTKAGITGVEIAARIIKECKPYCQGVHIMALGWESKIPELLKLAEI